MKDRTTLYRNCLLPDSDLLEAFMNSSRIYILWMITQSCSHPRNKLQGSKCGCMIELGESAVECLAMQQLAFFTQEKRCREARIFEWIKSAWVEKGTRKEYSDGSSRIREKERNASQMEGTQIPIAQQGLYKHKRENKVHTSFCVSKCSITVLLYSIR